MRNGVRRKNLLLVCGGLGELHQSSLVSQSNPQGVCKVKKAARPVGLAFCFVMQ